jgi:hypothetical protein
LERIIGITFGFIESNTFVLVESLGEIISVNNTENSAIDIEV